MRKGKFAERPQGVPTAYQGLAGQYHHSQWAVQHNVLALLQQGKGWLTNRFFFLLTVLLVIAITVGIFLYQERIAELSNYGYLGAFLASLAANATIFLPVLPNVFVILALGAFLNPLLVGLAAGTGAAIGEMTGYLAGYSGSSVIKNRKVYAKSVEWLKRWGTMTIFIFTVTPLPLDLAGIAAGALRFPLWKFFLACWFGKILLYTATALAGAWGWKIVLPYLS